MSTRHQHAEDYLDAIHHLAWNVVNDAFDDGARPEDFEPGVPVDVLGDVAIMTDRTKGYDDPRPYLRAAVDLLNLAEADAVGTAQRRIAKLERAVRRELEALDAKAGDRG